MNAIHEKDFKYVLVWLIIFSKDGECTLMYSSAMSPCPPPLRDGVCFSTPLSLGRPWICFDQEDMEKMILYQSGDSA